MEIKKLQTHSLKEDFVTKIEHAILSGKLPIGEKLPPERELSQQLGISRAVIKSGVAEMEKKGFLTVKPRVGTFVSDFRMGGKETLLSLMNYDGGVLCAEEVKSFNEFHCALDNMVILLAEDKLNEDNFNILDGYINGIGSTDRPDIAADYNFKFHHQLAIISENTIAPLLYSSFKSTFTSLWERYARKNGIYSLYHNSRVLLDLIHDGRAADAISWNDLYTDTTIFGEKQILEE